MDESETPDSVLTGMLKLFVRSLHLYQAKLNGPVPPGLTALSSPLWDPDVLQYIKTGSLTVGAEG